MGAVEGSLEHRPLGPGAMAYVDLYLLGTYPATWEVAAAWFDDPGPSGEPVLGFQLQFHNHRQGWTYESVVDGSEWQYSLGLSSQWVDEDFNFRIRGWNRHGYSPVSELFWSGNTWSGDNWRQEPYDVPSVPTGVVFDGWDTGELYLDWYAPHDDSDLEITGYTVTYWRSDGSGSERTLTTTDTNITITGLTDDEEYTAHVAASNVVGQGPTSDEVIGTPRETTAPEAPWVWGTMDSVISGPVTLWWCARRRRLPHPGPLPAGPQPRHW